MASMPKNMTLRLDDVLATELDMVAAVDGHPVAEAVRIAIVDHIEQRRTSEDFQRKLAANIERMRKMVNTPTTAKEDPEDTELTSYSPVSTRTDAELEDAERDARTKEV